MCLPLSAASEGLNGDGINTSSVFSALSGFIYVVKVLKCKPSVQTMICVWDWSCAGEKLANTTTATGAMRYIATYPGNRYNGSETG